MQKTGHGGPHTTPFMTIFGILFNPPNPNIEKIQLYDLYKSQEVHLGFRLDLGQADVMDERVERRKTLNPNPSPVVWAWV